MSELSAKRRVRLRSIISAYYQAVRRHRWLFVLLLFGTIALQFTELAIPLYLRNIFNILGSGDTSQTAMDALFGSLKILALLFLLEWAWRRSNGTAIVLFESRSMKYLYEVGFSYLIYHSQQFFSSQFTGTLTRRVAKFAGAFETLIDSLMFQFIPTTIFVVGAVYVLYRHSAVLGTVLGGWAFFMILLQLWLAKLRQPLREAQSEADSKTTGALSDAITNQNTISLFSAGRAEIERFAAVVDHWRKATVRSWIGDEYIWAVLGLFMASVEVVMLWQAIVLWQRGLVTIGDFVLMQAYLFTTFDRVVAINRDLRRFYNGLADATEMIEILEEPHGIQDAPNASRLLVQDGNIHFDDVEFTFVKDAPVLSHFSLQLSGGQKVALVGASGAGKSTITKLLLRLYDVSSGSISVDGQDIRSVTQESLRAAIGFVPQEPILFHRTLLENIRYGKPDATNEEVIEASKKAHAHEFISTFPDAYETFVGERGVKLSGGERQRVAIARAILKNAPILVLDEATSALDSESERYIQDALKTLMAGKTVIVIAHRLSTIMGMDRIVVMDHGAIEEDGTHDELVNKNGIYAKLWNIQAGGFIGDIPESV